MTGQLVVSSVPPVCDPSRSAAMGAVCVYNASRATPAPAVNASVRTAAWLEYALSIPARTGTALAVDENGTVYVAAGESLIVVDAGGWRLVPWVGGVSAMTLGALLYASV